MSGDKLTIPDVLDRFRAYHARNPSWGALHVVLDDGNIAEDHVVGCAVRAIELEDTEGYELAQILLQMSKTQRRKLSHVGRSDHSEDKVRQ